MPIITFEGASDDLIEVWAEGDQADTVEGQDEYAAYTSQLVHATFEVTDGIVAHLVDAKRLHVHALYGAGQEGTWSFAADLVEDGVPLPPWPITIRNSEGTPYSVRLEIEVPPGVRVFRITS